MGGLVKQRNNGKDNMETTNNGYIGIYKGKQYEVYASSSYYEEIY
jgi:hypothetical protein